MTKSEIIDAISNMSVLELSLLIKDLEEKFGVKASAPVIVGGQTNQVASEEKEEKEEKTIFDVHLVSFGENKIQVIKEVRVIIPGLGLKEAKELVESAPCELKKGVNKEEAEEIKKKLESVGAKVEIK